MTTDTSNVALSQVSNSSSPDVSTMVTQNWCYMQANVVEFNYIWAIEKFSFFQEGTEKAINSSTFSAGPNDQLKWCLRMYLKGRDEENEGYMSIYLLLVSCNQPKVHAKFKLSLINAKLEESMVSKSELVYQFSEGTNWGFKKFIRLNSLFEKARELLPSDTLTIFCEVSVMTGSVTISGQTTPMQFNVPENQLSEDFGNLFESQMLSDVTISLADGREIKAHKAVLAARSPVFEAMLQHMEENKYSRMEITDIEHDVLQEMLRFIYTGSANNVKEMADSLLAAADKYALERLKAMCEEVLHTSLSIESAAEILILADLHHAVQLKEQTIRFIKTHAFEVMSTAGWNALIHSHPHLIAEAFRALANQQISPIEPPKKKRKQDG